MLLDDDYFGNNRLKLGFKAAGKLAAKFAQKHGSSQLDSAEVSLTNKFDVGLVELKAAGSALSVKV